MKLAKTFPSGPFLWGNTIGLSWMWGLGLFFSVQFTVQFGVLGLLCFAIPNALGLFLFGFIADRAGEKTGGGPESLARFFDAWSKPFRLPLFLYQLAALALTIFAIIRYLWQPLGLEPWFIYLPLGILVVLAAAFLFGEEFGISRIKWSHTAMLLVALLAMAILLGAHRPALFSAGRPFAGTGEFKPFLFAGYAIPIFIGLLVGPWMDLQQWQRAIQIRREGRPVTQSYAFGSILFFVLLLFHGLLANWVMTQGGEQFVRSGLLDFRYGHEVLTRFFHAQIETHPVVFGAYAAFVCVCILSTLDSGYIALRWFFSSYLAQSQSMILSLLPAKLLVSPIPAFLVATFFALVALVFGMELEYFMILYATFFVAYSMLGMLRTLRGKTDLPLPQVKMFCVGALSVVIFSFGYLRDIPFFMTCGSLVPVGYICWMFIKSVAEPEVREELVEKKKEPRGGYLAPEMLAAAATAGNDAPLPQGDRNSNFEFQNSNSVAGHFEGKTFVHSFLSTYGDTNSVGNIYFGMYAMWVGKARELFLRKVLPEFDLETTDYYILTRSFEHKFVREAKEFENIRIEISVGEHNRKFVELNHKVLDGANKMLGKGKQTLMFVASKDYSLLDIPQQIQLAFAQYAPTLTPTLKS